VGAIHSWYVRAKLAHRIDKVERLEEVMAVSDFRFIKFITYRDTR